MRQDQQLSNMWSGIPWNFTSARSSFWNCLSHFLISRKACCIRLKKFSNSFRHGRRREIYRVLITEISTLVKTALKSYYSMLSPLAIPCLPNDEVVYTTLSSASMEIEAEWRLRINDHHHHHLHHHHCPVWVLGDFSFPFIAAKEGTWPT